MDLSQFPFVTIVKPFCKTPTISCFYSQKQGKFRYFFPSHLFQFYSLVQLLLPTVKLNRVSQPSSAKYKMVHGLNQAVFRI